MNGAVIDGDADWGSLKVGSVGGEYAVSEVKEYPDNSEKTFTLTKDNYGAGSGNTIISIRGSVNIFAWDNAVLEWEIYTVPVIRGWKYVQAKVEWNS